MAVSLLVEKGLVDIVIDNTKWGVDSKVKFAAGIPLLVIGAGTLILVYIMRRHHKVLVGLEVELNRLDPSFHDLMHPKGASGSVLLRVFLAIIAMGALDLGAVFFAGTGLQLVPVLLATTVVGIYLCRDAWIK